MFERAPFSSVPLCAFLGLHLGCSEPVIIAQIPFESPDVSAVAAVVSKGTTRYFGIDEEFRQMQPILRSIEGEAPIEIHVLYYERPLADLDLSSGALYSDAEGDILPPAVRALSAVIEGSEAVAWSMPAERPPAFREFKRVPKSPCRPFSADGPSLELDPQETALNFVSDADGVLWLVTTKGGFQEGGVRRVEVNGLGPALPMPVGFRATAAVGTATGELFVAGGRGRDLELLRGVPGETLTTATTTSGFSSDWPKHMVVGATEAGDEAIYMLAASGKVTEYAAGTLALLSDQAGNGSLGGLAWVQPGELLVLSPDGQRILRYSEGLLPAEPTALDGGLLGGSDELVSIAHMPGFGTFAGTETGFLLERRDREWSVAQSDTIVGATIEAIIPYRGGALVAGRYGIVDQIYEGTDYCEPRIFLGNDVTVEKVFVHAGRPVVVARRSVPGMARRYFVQWISADPR